MSSPIGLSLSLPILSATGQVYQRFTQIASQIISELFEQVSPPFLSEKMKTTSRQTEQQKTPPLLTEFSAGFG
jgi:hypothetical protein